MILTYANNIFSLKGLHEHNALVVRPLDPKQLGFMFNKYQGWFTNKVMTASLLRDYADEKAEKIFKRSFLRHSPWKGSIITPPGLKLLNHQTPSALYALSRSKSYLALAPGLGKTIVAALIAVSIGGRCLIVVPPFLALNTLEEFAKWAPKLHTKVIGREDWIIPDVLIVPDSAIHTKEIRDYIRVFKPKVIIDDEAHRMNHPTSRRAKGMWGYQDNRRKVRVPGIIDTPSMEKLILMSGTPMPNRPLELHQMLYKCYPESINFFSRDEYGMEYCGPRWNGFAHDFTGCSEKNFRKLMDRVKSKDAQDPKGFMLRLDKKILNLPPLTEETVILGLELPVVIKKMETDLLKQYSPEDLIKKFIALEMGTIEEELHLSTYRRLLGVHKVIPSAEYIQSILDETFENVIVFALHKEVIRELAERLKEWSPLVVTGDTPKKQRHELVRQFQNDLSKRLFLGNIDSVGVGFTLTKADRIIFVERSMVPGVNRQAIDRGHRYTLDHPLLVQSLLFRNSFDRKQYEMLTRKEHVTSIV